MIELTTKDLDAILAGDPGQLDVHLALIEEGLPIAGCETRVHCHCLAVDANGKVRIARLAEYLRLVLTDYAIPRQKITQARKRDSKYNSTVALNALLFEAKALFTDLEKSGEGGEMLLYVLAQHFLKLPQVLCKMDLKTDPKMHYHGADGVYVGIADDGVLKLYWGESKVYANPAHAIRACIESIAPYLAEEDSEDTARERDLVLLSDKADLNDPKITSAFRKYFDKSSPLSNQVRYCGIALAGFDANFYPKESAAGLAKDIATAARGELENWVKQAGKHVSAQKLDAFEIHLLCVPMPSVDGFRKAFLKALGVTDDA
jgi:hypothetical protein